MRRLRDLENALIRAESAVAVVLVLLMLSLAAYNVVYRNVLVKLQYHWAHSGPPIETVSPPTDSAPSDVAVPPTTAKPSSPGEPTPSADAGGDFGGFGGGLSDEPAGDAPDEAAEDDFGGFGGGLGDDEESEPEAAKPAAKPEAKPDEEPAGGDFGGFGGGFGEDEESEPAAEPMPAGADDFGGFGGGLGEGDGKSDDDGAEGFGGGLGAAEPDDGDDDLGDDDFGEDDLGDDDQFANLPDIDAVGQDRPLTDAPQGGPPPEGSFAAWAVQTIDDIKLDWIDIFLRQLVIIVSFLGAMLATQRRKHINIDALSKLLPPGAQRVVGVLMPLFALGICLVLARAGWDLVQISREFSQELLPFADEWHMQLMFPVGFGLLAVHFGVRVVEAAIPEEPVPEPRRPSDVVTRADDEDMDVAEAEAERKAMAAAIEADANTAARLEADANEDRPEAKSGVLGAEQPSEDGEESEEVEGAPVQTAGDDEGSVASDEDGSEPSVGGQD